MRNRLLSRNRRATTPVVALFCVVCTLQVLPVNAGVEVGLSASVEYDSNILPEADTTTQNTGDWAQGAGVNIGWQSDNSSGLEWQGRYDFSATRWQQASEFDTDLHSAYIRASYNRGAHTADLVVLLARADLQGMPFMSIRRISPAWGYFLNEHFYLRGQFDAGDKRFQLYPERDATQLGGRATIYWLLDRTRNYLSLRTVYRDEDTRSEPYGYESVNTRLRWKLRAGGVKYRLQGSIERRQYEAIWTDIGARREDDRIRISAGFEWPLGRGFTFETDVGRDIYRSNLDEADYRQFRLSSELSWVF